MNTYTLAIRFFKYGLPDFIKGTLKKEKNVRDRGFGRVWDKRKSA